MIIKKLVVNNILSFKNETKIHFNDGVNILIGPNGSGKSNVIDILTYIFTKVFFLIPEINYLNIGNIQNKKNTISMDLRNLIANIKKNNWNTGPQSISIYLEINQSTLENILILIQNKEKILSIVENYTNINGQTGARVNQTQLESIVNELSNISKTCYKIKINITDQKYTLEGDANLINYLQYYGVLQSSIEIYNHINANDKIPKLKQGFLMIPPFRNYHNFSKSINIQGSKEQKEHNQKKLIAGKDTKSYDNSESPLFGLMKEYLGYKYIELCDQRKGIGTHTLTVEEELKQDHKLKLLTKLLKDSGISINFNFKENENRTSIDISILKDDQEVNIEDMSAGQKGVLILLVGVIFLDISEGFLIIDEPEVHLHKQIQKIVLDILYKNHGIQSIIATHSDVFIDQRSIKNVIRLSNNNPQYIGSIVSYFDDISDEEHQKILRIIHNSKYSDIFFYDKVVLVEGEADYIWFSKLFYEVYPELKYKVCFIDIGGKGQKDKRFTFLEKIGFEIGNRFFIGDQDCAIDGNIKTNIFEYLKSNYMLPGGNVWSRIMDQDIPKTILGESFYNTICNLIKLEEDESIIIDKSQLSILKEIWKKLVNIRIPSKVYQEGINKGLFLDQIKEVIENKKRNGELILSLGSLEAYTGIHKCSDQISRLYDRFTDSNINDFKSSEAPTHTEIKEIFKVIADGPIPLVTVINESSTSD